MGTTPEAGITPGILPCALRARLRLFQIAPGDFVSLHAGVASEAHERETRDDRLETVAHDIVQHFLGRGFVGKRNHRA